MFGAILISVFTLIHIYVFRQISSVPFIKRHISPMYIIGAGIILWASLFLGRVVGHSGSGLPAVILEFLGMTWMGVLFLLFVSLLACDIITGFGFLMPRVAPFLRGWALGAGVVLAGIALIQGFRPPAVNQYEVRLCNLPAAAEGMVIVALSDLHLGSLLGAGWLAERVREVQGEKPDLVVLLGDIIEGHGPPDDEVLSILKRLSAPFGVWAVAGNHEFHRGGGTNMTMMKKTGFQLLSDRWAEVLPGLVVAGVDDLTHSRRVGRDDDHIAKALAERPPGATILLSHTPWGTEEAAKAAVGLMLCGHTHAGQIWPFGYIVRLVYPLLEGRYDVDGMTVIVSRGTGTWGPRMRLWRRGEILRVTVKSKR